MQEVHLKATERLVVRRLTKTQKTELFKTIRYGFLKNDELLALAANPVFELAKNFIVEGLAAKLEHDFESLQKKGLQININPRVYYEINSTHPAKKEEHSKGTEELKGGLQSMFDQALYNKSHEPLQKRAAASKATFANYEERKQFEEREAQKDVIKNQVLGGGVKNLFHEL